MRITKPFSIVIVTVAVFSLLVFLAGGLFPHYALAAEKTLEELQAELDAKINNLNTLTAEQTLPERPAALSNRLTAADGQTADADSALSTAAGPLSPVIPLAVSAAAFGALFLCCSLLIHKIRSRIEKDDFIK